VALQGAVYALNAHTGKQYWHYELNQPIDLGHNAPPLVISQGVWLLRTNESKLLAVDIATGKELWAHKPRTRRYLKHFSIPVVKDGFALLDKPDPKDSLQANAYQFYVLAPRKGTVLRQPMPMLK